MALQAMTSPPPMASTGIGSLLRENAMLSATSFAAMVLNCAKDARIAPGWA
jgi:hypothetical protein